jgi:hypothetical protein
MLNYLSYLTLSLNFYIARTLYISALYMGNYVNRFKAVFDC